jgi:crotonobetainyl-CoA:carnitine CoA-transferase CaiB-like acyl-CoA transferase
MTGPLEGIKVIELGVWVAGPAAGGILADWGADVIKVEPPAGDPARMFGRMLGIESGESPPFEMDNRGKRSIVLDLATDDGRATALDMITTADVFLTNVRPARTTSVRTSGPIPTALPGDGSAAACACQVRARRRSPTARSCRRDRA